MVCTHIHSLLLPPLWAVALFSFSTMDVFASFVIDNAKRRRHHFKEKLTDDGSTFHVSMKFVMDQSDEKTKHVQIHDMEFTVKYIREFWDDTWTSCRFEITRLDTSYDLHVNCNWNCRFLDEGRLTVDKMSISRVAMPEGSNAVILIDQWRYRQDSKVSVLLHINVAKVCKWNSLLQPDTVLVCEDKEYNVSRVNLAHYSNYFLQLFADRCTTRYTVEICTSAELDAFLSYVDTSHVELRSDIDPISTFTLSTAARKLDAPMSIRTHIEDELITRRKFDFYSSDILMHSKENDYHRLFFFALRHKVFHPNLVDDYMFDMDELDEMTKNHCLAWRALVEEDQAGWDREEKEDDEYEERMKKEEEERKDEVKRRERNKKIKKRREVRKENRNAKERKMRQKKRN